MSDSISKILVDCKIALRELLRYKYEEQNRAVHEWTTEKLSDDINEIQNLMDRISNVSSLPNLP